jgi:hypothetical protein
VKPKEMLELRFHRLQMRRHYRHTFNTPSGRIVLNDLRQFCGHNRDLFVKDNERLEACYLGMLRVFLRITHWINMDMEEIEALKAVGGEEDV